MIFLNKVAKMNNRAKYKSLAFSNIHVAEGGVFLSTGQVTQTLVSVKKNTPTSADSLDNEGTEVNISSGFRVGPGEIVERNGNSKIIGRPAGDTGKINFFVTGEAKNVKIQGGMVNKIFYNNPSTALPFFSAREKLINTMASMIYSQVEKGLIEKFKPEWNKLGKEGKLQLKDKSRKEISEILAKGFSDQLSKVEENYKLKERCAACIGEKIVAGCNELDFLLKKWILQMDSKNLQQRSLS